MGNQQQGSCLTKEGLEVSQIKFAKDYYVSKCGRVFSCKISYMRELKPYNNKGYLVVGVICNDGVRRGFFSHRLVADTYIPNPLGKPQVNHLDGIKTNNKVDNLEWTTSHENMNHAYRMGLVNSSGENNPRNILREEDVLYIYNQCLQGAQRKPLAEKFGIDEATLSDIISKRNWEYLTKDLPDVEIRGKSTPLTEREVRLVCSMLQTGEKSSKIYDAVGRDRLTKYNLFDIKRRRVFKEISKDYSW